MLIPPFSMTSAVIENGDSSMNRIEAALSATSISLNGYSFFGLRPACLSRNLS
jgi:hypothetical protein